MFRFKFPKNDAQFGWTNHIKNKMIFYGLSEQKIRAVMKSPTRVEEGIAPDTIAAMQSSRGRKKPEEVWVMYRETNNQRSMANDQKLRRGFISGKSLVPTRQSLGDGRANRSRILMISAWRYPGISKPGTHIPIPDTILEELINGGMGIEILA